MQNLLFSDEYRILLLLNIKTDLDPRVEGLKNLTVWPLLSLQYLWGGGMQITKLMAAATTSLKLWREAYTLFTAAQQATKHLTIQSLAVFTYVAAAAVTPEILIIGMGRNAVKHILLRMITHIKTLTNSLAQ